VIQDPKPGDWIRIYEVLDPQNKRAQMSRQLIYEGLLLSAAHSQPNLHGRAYPVYKLLQVDGCVKELHLRYDGYKFGVGEVRYDVERVYSGA
jgi:hypothetical protein